MNEPDPPSRESRGSTPDEWPRRQGPRPRIDTGTIVWGLVLVAVGGWFFLDRTLGLDLPEIDWGDVWPIVLIVMGIAVILRGLARRRT